MPRRSRPGCGSSIEQARLQSRILELASTRVCLIFLLAMEGQDGVSRAHPSTANLR
jgi:hypothetical protein